MTGIVAEPKTNGDFLEMLFATESGKLLDARHLLGDILKFQLAKSIATPEGVEDLAVFFAERIFSILASLKGSKTLHKEKFEQIGNFFEEIARIALSFGLKVRLTEAKSILDQA